MSEEEPAARVDDSSGVGRALQAVHDPTGGQIVGLGLAVWAAAAVCVGLWRRLPRVRSSRQ